MAKNQLDDFAATLTAQLKDAAEQMRNMRTPPEHDQNTNKSNEITNQHISPTATDLTSQKTQTKKSTTPPTPQKSSLTKKQTTTTSTPPKTKQKNIKQKHSTTKKILSPPSKNTPAKTQTDRNKQSVTANDYSIQASQTAPTITTPIDPNTLLLQPMPQDIFVEKSTTMTEDSGHEPSMTVNDLSKPIQSQNYTSQTPYVHLDYQEKDTKNNLNHPQTNTFSTISTSQQYLERNNSQGQSYIDINSHRQSVIVNDTSTQPITPWGYYSPEDLKSVQINTASIGGARQLVLDALIQLKQEASTVTINLKRLATVLGLSYGTVRNTISRLVREGIICTTQIRTGDVHGVYIEFPEYSPLLQTVTVTHPSTTYAPQQPTTTQQTNHEQYNNPIWNIDTETLTRLWPHAAAAGLTPNHLEYLKKAYQIQKFDDTHLAQYLRYLNWTIQNEAYSPTHSTEILNQWLQTMQQHGQYPCPSGYTELN